MEEYLEWAKEEGEKAECWFAQEEWKRFVEYVERVEAERDYYMESSAFAGVPSQPRPKGLERK